MPSARTRLVGTVRERPSQAAQGIAHVADLSAQVGEQPVRGAVGGGGAVAPDRDASDQRGVEAGGAGAGDVGLERVADHDDRAGDAEAGVAEAEQRGRRLAEDVEAGRGRVTAGEDGGDHRRHRAGGEAERAAAARVDQVAIFSFTTSFSRTVKSSFAEGSVAE